MRCTNFTTFCAVITIMCISFGMIVICVRNWAVLVREFIEWMDSMCTLFPLGNSTIIFDTTFHCISIQLLSDFSFWPTMNMVYSTTSATSCAARRRTIREARCTKTLQAVICLLHYTLPCHWTRITRTHAHFKIAAIQSKSLFGAVVARSTYLYW